MTKDRREEIEKVKGIDWNEVHRRMDLAQTAVENGVAYTSEEKQAILKARARDLSAETKADVSGKFIETIEFRLASETYGVETLYVREVYPLKKYTALPGTPSFVLGIINVHGQILSVIDLKSFFNLPERGLGDLNKVIILRNDRMEFGILADVILGTRAVMEDEIQASPFTVTGIGAEYLRGIAGDGTIILDASKILGDKRIIVHD